MPTICMQPSWKPGTRSMPPWGEIRLSSRLMLPLPIVTGIGFYLIHQPPDFLSQSHPGWTKNWSYPSQLYQGLPSHLRWRDAQSSHHLPQVASFEGTQWPPKRVGFIQFWDPGFLNIYFKIMGSIHIQNNLGLSIQVKDWVSVFKFKTGTNIPKPLGSIPYINR